MSCLQHVVKAAVADQYYDPISRCKLPSTLRELLLFLHDWRELKATTLPPRLTLLVLLELDTIALQPGVLPQSLLTLGLHYNDVVQESTDPSTCIQPISAGVLPSQLLQLEIMWSRSLTDLALPASLTQLTLFFLPNLPIPLGSLPAGSQRLSISTMDFDLRNLRGALPSSLRVRLCCSLTHPLTAELLSGVPQLEELNLDKKCMYRLTAGLFASLTQLRVLRLTGYKHSVAAGELPPSLRRS